MINNDLLKKIKIFFKDTNELLLRSFIPKFLSKKNINTFLLCMSLMIFNPSASFGQSKTGTTIGQFLKIEPSSRGVGIGNAGVSQAGEASLAYYNPASLGWLKGTDIQFTYNKWLADIDYNYTIAAVNFEGLGTVSLVLTSLNSGEIDVRTVEKPMGTGEKYSVTNFLLGIGYGIMLTDRVSVGLQLNYINESIWHSDLNAFGMNFGVQYQLMEGDFTIGASVSNFGTNASFSGRDLYINYDFDPDKYGDNDRLPAGLRVESYSLPTVFRAGVTYVYKFDDSYNILFSADAVHPNDNNESINMGTEINLINLLSVRAGYRNFLLADREGGLVVGGGIKSELYNSLNVRFDYAWADYGRLDGAHRLTISVGYK
jgi:hypothetical protein